MRRELVQPRHITRALGELGQQINTGESNLEPVMLADNTIHSGVLWDSGSIDFAENFYQCRNAASLRPLANSRTAASGIEHQSPIFIARDCVGSMGYDFGLLCPLDVPAGQLPVLRALLNDDHDEEPSDYQLHFEDFGSGFLGCAWHARLRQ